MRVTYHSFTFDHLCVRTVCRASLGQQACSVIVVMEPNWCCEGAVTETFLPKPAVHRRGHGK